MTSGFNAFGDKIPGGVAAYNAATPGGPPMSTMSEVFARYRKECLPKLAASTQRGYMSHLAVLEQYFGALAPGQIRPRDVGRFLDVPSGKQNRNKQVAVLSAVYTIAIGRWFVDGCDVNPCLTVERHESHARTRYITDDEFSALYAMAPDNLKLAMDIALLTGQRQGDILDLTWLQVYPAYIEITQSKTGKRLGIKITPALEEVLLRARRRSPLYPRWHVVRTRTGEPYTHDGFRQMWQRTMVAALKKGIIKTRFTFHDIRAKCASDKASLQGASELLGHGDLKLTRRVYDRNIRMVDPLR